MEIVQTKSPKLKFDDLEEGKIYTVDYQHDYHGAKVEVLETDYRDGHRNMLHIVSWDGQRKYTKLLSREYCEKMSFVGENKAEYTIKVDNKELDLLKAISKYYLNVFDYGGDQSVLAKKIRDYNAE